ncbi:MAG: GGDEF domain-containing protein [Lachnospiraceae bacterium]
MTYLKKFTLTFITIFLFFMSGISTVSAKSDLQTASNTSNKFNHKIVKVGIADTEYFSKKQSDGSYQGILIDYLQEISKYTGWQLEYVESSVDKLIPMLEKGEIDIMGAMLKNSTTLSMYDFAEYSSGYSYTTLNVLESNDNYKPMDYTSFNGMRVGIYSKALNRISSYSAFVESNGLDMTTVYYDDRDSFCNALELGEVDAIVTNDTSENLNQKTIAKFGIVPYYFGITKGNYNLLQELNYALATILEINPNFNDIVYQKYINKNRITLTLSKSEAAFVDTVGKLKVAIVSNLVPLEYYDTSSHKVVGIAPDILKEITAKTNLQFEFVQVQTLTEAKNLLLSGQVDLITGLSDNKANTNEPDLVFTRHYLDSPNITVHASMHKEGSKLTAALPTGYIGSELEKDTKVQYYDSIEECIQQVMKGHVDFTCFNSLVIDHYTYLRGNNHVTLIPSTTNSDGLSFGLSRSADPALLSILDKAINNIPADTIQSIVYENTTIENTDLNMTSLLYTYPKTFILIICLIIFILLITILMIFLFMRARLQLAKQEALHGESYRIIGALTGEYIFSYDFDKGKLILPDSFAQLIGHKHIITKKEIETDHDNFFKILLSVFEPVNAETGTAIVLRYDQSNGDSLWFKSIGTVQFNSEEKPFRGIGKIISIQKEMLEKEMLKNKANRDSLTGLFNRQYCEQHILEHFEEDKANGLGALIIVDIDNFKIINDTFGHLIGDQALIEFAEIFSNEFLEDDIFGRWGGDEFIAYIRCLPNDSSIEKRIAHLCQSAHREFYHKGKSHMMSISIGVAFTKNVISYKQLFENADAALYSVKNNQRNGFEFK